jgi:uncharacterized cysteine cluster protein YcgN (CxxCxxCC family)
LISGDKQLMHESGKSVKGKVRKMEEIDGSLEDYVVDWP